MTHDQLRIYQRELSVIDPRRIVLISGHEPIAKANAFAKCFPGAEVYLVATRRRPELTLPGPRVHYAIKRSVDAIHHHLVPLGPVDVIVEDGTSTAPRRIRCFAELLYHLRDGGVYAFEERRTGTAEPPSESARDDPRSYVDRLVSERDGIPVEEPTNQIQGDDARARTIADVAFHGHIGFVTKSGSHYLKLNDVEATKALKNRVGPRWGEVLRVRPAEDFIPRSTVTTNDPRLARRFARRFEIRDLSLREFNGVVCAPGQITVRDELLLPCAFHQVHARYPKNRHFRDTGRFFAQPKADLTPRSVLRGAFYHLDSEFPGHYGHFVTEDIARLWGFDEAQARYPGIKVLLSAEPGSGSAQPFQYEFLAAVGITPADVVVIDEPVAVETLVAASQEFQNPIFVSPFLVAMWQRIARALRTPTPGRPSRLFVTRSESYSRRCKNGTDLESLFVRYGFEVVEPEKHPLGDQIDMFEQAQVIAGYGGSALFNRMFAEGPRTQIIIGSSSYLGRARNEYLIGALLGDDMHYFQCETHRRALHADYTFDFDRDGPALVKLLETL